MNRLRHSLHFLAWIVGVWLACIGAIAFLSSCKIPEGLSGARHPTAYTFELTEADIAEAHGTECVQDWVTGDFEKDMDTVYAEAARLGITIKKGNNPFATGSATPKVMYIDKSLDAASPAWQVSVYSHELVHYCDSRRVGFVDFNARYLHSAGRWVFETRAYAQSVRTLRIYGHTDREVKKWIDTRLTTYADRYWLHDIDPAQFERETAAVLEEAAGL